MPTILADEWAPVDVNEAEVVIEGPQLIVIKGGSQKTYRVGLSFHRERQLWLAWAEWGRIGRPLTTTIMYAGSWLDDAWQHAAAKELEKHDKGYKLARPGQRLLGADLSSVVTICKANRYPRRGRGERVHGTWSQRRGGDDEVPI